MKFSVANALVVASALRDAAQSEVLPRFRAVVPNTVRTKSSPLDLVTDADVAAEAHIMKSLAQAFPNALLVGEESAARDPHILEGLAAAELALVIDPIDGTKNFASGLPLFGVMAGVLHRGTIVAGVIHDPITDDFAIAVRGEGAWIERPDGSRTDLKASAPLPVAEMLGMVSWMFMPEPLRSTVTGNLACVAGAADYRTAAHEYRLIAGGHYDFLMFAKLAPWDHVPGVLLHREAGGYSACFDGEPYAVDRPAQGLLCAPDEASWLLLREMLLGKRE